MTLGLWLRYTLLLMLLVAFCGYVIWQARFLLAGPQIVIFEAPTPAQTERQITIAGQANNITLLTLNGRPITTNETGWFEEAVILENGYTIISLQATDRYGRTTQIIRPFVYLGNDPVTTNS